MSLQRFGLHATKRQWNDKDDPFGLCSFFLSMILNAWNPRRGQDSCERELAADAWKRDLGLVASTWSLLENLVHWLGSRLRKLATAERGRAFTRPRERRERSERRQRKAKRKRAARGPNPDLGWPRLPCAKSALHKPWIFVLVNKSQTLRSPRQFLVTSSPWQFMTSYAQKLSISRALALSFRSNSLSGAGASGSWLESPKAVGNVVRGGMSARFVDSRARPPPPAPQRRSNAVPSRRHRAASADRSLKMISSSHDLCALSVLNLRDLLSRFFLLRFANSRSQPAEKTTFRRRRLSSGGGRLSPGASMSIPARGKSPPARRRGGGESLDSPSSSPSRSELKRSAICSSGRSSRERGRDARLRPELNARDRLGRIVLARAAAMASAAPAQRRVRERLDACMQSTGDAVWVADGGRLNDALSQSAEAQRKAWSVLSGKDNLPQSG